MAAALKIIPLALEMQVRDLIKYLAVLWLLGVSGRTFALIRASNDIMVMDWESWCFGNVFSQSRTNASQVLFRPGGGSIVREFMVVHFSCPQ